MSLLKPNTFLGGFTETDLKSPSKDYLSLIK